MTLQPSVEILFMLRFNGLRKVFFLNRTNMLSINAVKEITSTLLTSKMILTSMNKMKNHIQVTETLDMIRNNMKWKETSYAQRW